MVHALREAWRVLVARGTLVDLRPCRTPACPLEIVTAGAAAQVGSVDATGCSAGDLAADAAMHQVVEGGWFELSSRCCFDFELYWDTVTDFEAFLESSSRMGPVTPSLGAVRRAHRDLSRAHGCGRVRCRRPMTLAAYVRAPREAEAV